MEFESTQKPSAIPSWKLYQEFVDKIFGVGVLTIKATTKDNYIIGTLNYSNKYREFIRNFEARLKRLKHKFEHTKDYKTILEQVKQIANPKNWEGAYAELVAYDVICNGYHGDKFNLNVSMPAEDSYAADLGGGETNEDVYLSDYDLYFDVKCLSDTVDIILKGVIDEATDCAGLQGVCDILPEYPLDDSEEDYQNHRCDLMNELKKFLIDIPTERRCKSRFTSNIIGRLSYNIIWGKGTNSRIGTYDPYEHAENTRHIMLKRYTKKFMKKKSFMTVLVNFPWYNNRIKSFCNADEVYYRSIARRTFCGYRYSTQPANSILPKYHGVESLHEISRHLSGIIFIDDHSIESDTYSCHIYTNPNAENPVKSAMSYLREIIRQADKHSIYDDLQHDNY